MRADRIKSESYQQFLREAQMERAQAKLARNRHRCDMPVRPCAKCNRNFKPIGKYITRCDACKSHSQFELVELRRVQ